MSVEFFNQHAFAVLGAIAATTARIRIGTGIANAFTRAPLVHATAAMDLDELSGGRMVLGLGSGTRRMNIDWWGVPFEKPAARMRELIELHARRASPPPTASASASRAEFWDLKIPVFTRPGARARPADLDRRRSTSRCCAPPAPPPTAWSAIPIATRRWHREMTLPTLRAAEAAAGRPPAPAAWCRT